MINAPSNQTVRELREVIRRVLRDEFAQLARANGLVPRTGPLIYLAVTGSGGVPPKTESALGNAEVTLQYIDANGNRANQTNEAGDPVTVTAYNDSTVQVAADSAIQLHQEILSGHLMVCWEDCPSS